MYYVFKDPEFAEANKALLDQFGIDIRTTGAWGDALIPTGKEAIFWKEQRMLTGKYCISLAEWEHFNTLPVHYYWFPNIVMLDYDQEREVVQIEVKPTITFEEIRKLYGVVKNFRHLYSIDTPATKRKEPEDPPLIYAIFKAKQKGKKFREIFALYQGEKLDYYPRKGNHYLTTESLRKYYNTHSPEEF